MTDLDEVEPEYVHVVSDVLLEVPEVVGGRPLQEDVEGDGRALLLDLLHQRREVDRVAHLRESGWVLKDKLQATSCF